VKLDPVLASRIGLLEGVESWEDPRVAEFGLPAYEWERPAVEVIHVEPSQELSVPVRVYRPPSLSSRGTSLLWVHGGGFAGGNIDMPESDYVATELAFRVGTKSCRWTTA
jgi:acetyl esterase